MILYVDETENDNYFIVVCLLMRSERLIDNVYHSFKKRIRNYKISKNDKYKVYTEFKSTILDNGYQRIKRKLLESIAITKHTIIYSAYIKKNRTLNQLEKEDIYIELLNSIVKSIRNNIKFDIIFDRFNNSIFENRIIKTLSKYSNVNRIISSDSQIEPGIQYVDNICSVIRMHLSNNDVNNYFDIIKDNVYEVKII